MSLQCRYTGRLLSADAVAWVGATMPGVKARYPASTDAEGMAARKADRAAFNELDANCNTCESLIRVPHPKHPSGMLAGRCGIAMVRGVMRFHPDDWMGMECWAPRNTPAKPEAPQPPKHASDHQT